MNQVFGIDEDIVSAIARLSAEQVVSLKELESKCNPEEHQLLNELLSALKQERWGDWMLEGRAVAQWLRGQNDELYFEVAAILGKSGNLFSTESISVAWLAITWLDQSITSGVFKELSKDSFRGAPVFIHKRIFPQVKEILLEKACDRPWQERVMLENYLDGFEQALMEAEVQATLLMR